MRSEKEILIESKRFANETPWVSWWCLASTSLVWSCCVAATILVDAWWLRLPCSCLLGLVHVRLFVIYHDFQHGALLAKSRIARAFMFLFGCVTLSPPSVWRRSHDHHHRNNAKLFGASIGSYPVMTTEAYANASFWQRVKYKFARHPITIGAGYLTVFFLGMTVRPLFLNPKRHWDAICSLLVHAGAIVALAFTDPLGIVFVTCVPMIIAGGTGAYLFYAQHNYPSVSLKMGKDWNYVTAALKSSSFIKMNPILHWFTANIGYHHVHHLNHKIPFYKLPKAMAAIKELHDPGVTSLMPWDVYKCLRLKLWDESEDRLVSFAWAKRQRRATRVSV